MVSGFHCFLACLAILPGILSWDVLPKPAQPRAAESEATESAFREAVSLWASERYESLWERGDSASQRDLSKEQFMFRMRDRVLKPACCFRQVRELAVTLRTPVDALVRAKMGFDSRMRGTTFDTTLNFSLLKEEGEWRVAIRDFLHLPDESLHRLFLGPPQSRPR
jgi:hypothetical protein